MQNHEIAQHGELVESPLGDAVDPRGQAMRDAMWKGHGGFEIALSPVIFGGLGWVLDGYVGWTPVFTVAFVILGFVGSIANQYYRYRDAMEIATAERLERTARNVTSGGTTTGGSTPARPFGRVDHVEVDMSIDFNSPRLGATNVDQLGEATS